MSVLPLPLPRFSAPAREVLSPTATRSLFLLLIVLAAVAGVLATGPTTAHTAAAQAGADLTRLLRLMTLIKVALAAAAVVAVLWRFGWPVSAARFVVYALGSATMVAGPGLIWRMAHVGLGALLLHVGLAATVVVMWRDPAVRRAMDDTLKQRAFLRARRTIDPIA